MGNEQGGGRAMVTMRRTYGGKVWIAHEDGEWCAVLNIEPYSGVTEADCYCGRSYRESDLDDEFPFDPHDGGGL